MYRNNKYNLKKIETDRIYKRAFSMDNVGVWEWNINKDQMFICEKAQKQFFLMIVQIRMNY